MAEVIALEPQNLEAEEYVLGAMMLSAGAIIAVQEVGLRARDFYRPSHGQLYQAACDMNDVGDPVDPVMLLAEVQRRRIDISEDRVREIATLVPAATNAPHHAKLIRHAAALRELTKAGRRIVDLGEAGAGTTDELLEQAEEALRRATDSSATTRAASTLAEALAEIGADIKHAQETGERKRGLLTGFKALDDGCLSGLWGGQLILIAARPGMGKSTLAQNLSENIADAGGPVLFVSLEMSKRELAGRSLARASRVDGRLIEGGIIPENLQQRVRDGYRKVNARTAIEYQDDGGLTLATIKAEARRLKRTKGLKLLVVDYIQLLVNDPRNVVNELGQISRGLKLLARDLDIPVVALSQLNRGLESRAEKRPTKADLRDSGALEQDADVIIFLFNAAAYDSSIPDEDAAKTEIIIDKNRRGPTGTEYMDFIERYLSFNDRTSSSVPVPA
jgi:replicative DNA helicase